MQETPAQALPAQTPFAQPPGQSTTVAKYEQLPLVQTPEALKIVRWVASAQAAAGGWSQKRPRQGSLTQAPASQAVPH